MEISYLTYLIIFLLTGLVGFVAAYRAKSINDPDTRRGLFYLLITSGIWSMSHFFYLLSQNRFLSVVFYEIGLIFGLAAVGAWLYFCSAYTNRTLHRDPLVRWIAVGVFLAMISVKVTNPIHGAYFSISYSETPFIYYAIDNKMLHWLFMAASYSLSFIGYFMLFERFTQLSEDRAPLLALVSITALPILFDFLGYYNSLLIDITYEPIGVIIFGVGVLYLYLDSFEAIQVAGSQDKPILVLDNENRIKEFNEEASSVFPDLIKETIGKEIEKVLPGLWEKMEEDDSLVDLIVNRSRRFYRITRSPFSAHQEQLGQVTILEDVTEKRRIEEREELLHSLLRHDVQNKNQVVQGYGELLKEKEVDQENLEMINKDLEATKESKEIIKKVRALKDLKEEEVESKNIESVIKEVVAEKKQGAEEKDIEIELEKLNCLEALSGSLIKEALANLVENAIKHSGGEKIKISCHEEDDEVMVVVEDDGVGIPDKEKEKVFNKGMKSEKTGGTGLGLYLVREIITKYGGKIVVDDSELGGASFQVYLRKP